MASKLPEETVHEILVYALSITPEHRFLRACNWEPQRSMTKLESLGCTTPEPQTLRVCKRWRRIGTPILYRSVFLYCKDHVKNFADTLSANPELGKLVRNLRLDGGYGTHLYAASKHLKNLHSLAILSDILAKESTAGLARALPTLNPVQVFFRGPIYHYARNKKSQDVFHIFCKAITNWPSLVSNPLYLMDYETVLMCSAH